MSLARIETVSVGCLNANVRFIIVYFEFSVSVKFL